MSCTKPFMLSSLRRFCPHEREFACATLPQRRGDEQHIQEQRSQRCKGRLCGSELRLAHVLRVAKGKQDIFSRSKPRGFAGDPGVTERQRARSRSKGASPTTPRPAVLGTASRFRPTLCIRQVNRRSSWVNTSRVRSSRTWKCDCRTRLF